MSKFPRDNKVRNVIKRPLSTLDVAVDGYRTINYGGLINDAGYAHRRKNTAEN